MHYVLSAVDGLHAGSIALLVDAADFFGGAANHGPVARFSRPDADTPPHGALVAMRSGPGNT